MARTKYGLNWSDNPDDLQIEMYMCQKGGRWKIGNRIFGNGLAYHYGQMRRIIWPELDEHRWHILCREEIFRENAKVTVLMGPASSGKTHEAAWSSLCKYFVDPDNTCVLVSSTDIRGLRLRVWGEITMLWEKAVERFPYLPGHLLDSKIAITTDSLKDGEVDDRTIRDMRKGIIGIPTVVGGRFIGLGKWVGIKQKNLFLVADEAQMMGSSFLSAFSNLNGNGHFEAIVLGNPNDPLDPLGKAAEPKDGWTEEYLEPNKTKTWSTRFMGGRCVNLIGTDSPNMDFPQDKPPRYPYLISSKKISETTSFFSKDSVEYYSMCIGSMKIGTIARRVLSRNMCVKFGAQERAKFSGDEPTTQIYFVDAAYGGDRCIGGSAEFGKDINGKMILAFNEPKIIPIKIGKGIEPEYQIAEFMKEDCEQQNIPPENVGHDATGRGSLGTALARIWSNQTHPIESGGKPTDRPVSLDMFITDPETQERRLMLCSEHYDRRVTEFWFSLRYCVESGQIRQLPEEALDELCMRKWDMVKNKKWIEPKDGTQNRPGMKQRIGKSPDVGDWASGIVEMARRKGFQISRLSNSEKKRITPSTLLQASFKSYSDLIKSRELQTI